MAKKGLTRVLAVGLVTAASSFGIAMTSVSTSVHAQPPPSAMRHASQHLSSQPAFRPHDLVVVFAQGVSEERIAAIIHGQANTTILGEVPSLRTYFLRLPAGLSPLTAAVSYRGIPGVVSANPNDVYRTESEPLYPQQWALNNTGTNPGYDTNFVGFPDADIDAPEAWAFPNSIGSTLMRIAILDCGIDTTNPDLPPTKVVAQQNFSGTGICAHGTHVAGIAAALTNNTLIAGTCPLCTLVDAQVLDNNGSGDDSTLIPGITWAVTQENARVLNMSFGAHVPCSPALQNAINTYSAPPWNRIFVAAAGNEHLNIANTPYSPAGCDNVVTVAATDARDDKAFISNWGDHTSLGKPVVELAAPGIDILSDVPTIPGLSLPPGCAPVAPNWVCRASGTSMAAAFVSGAIGVLWNHMGLATAPGAVLSQLYGSADRIDGTNGFDGVPNWNVHSWEYGRLNLCKAVGAPNCDIPSPKYRIPAAPFCDEYSRFPRNKTVSFDLSTGATNGKADNWGTVDGKWRVTEVPSATHNPGQVPGNYPIGTYPAYSVQPLPGWWVSPAGTDANWIDPLEASVPNAPSTGPYGASPGQYVYQVKFLLPQVYAGITLSGYYAADDYSTFSVDGAQIGIPPNLGFAARHPFSLSWTGFGPFDSGSNDLTVAVANSGAPTGLLLHAVLKLTCRYTPNPG